MSRKNRLAHAFGSAMGARLGTAFLNYALFWSLTRLVDNETIGGFSLLMNVFFLLQLLPLLGLSVPMMRRIATSPQDMASEIANAFFFAMPISIAIAVLVGAWGQQRYGQSLSPSFWLVAASLVPSAWTIVAEATLIGREKYSDIARIMLVESLLRTVLALLAIHLGYGLSGVFVAFFALRVLAALLYARHPDLPLPRWRLVTRELQRRNWREVPIFLGIAIVTALTSRLDVIVLSYLRDLADVGVYSAAVRLYEASLMIPTVLALVLMPVLARQFAAARDRFGATLEVAIRTSLTLGIGLALPASALSGLLIRLLYKPDMIGAASVLGLFAFASAIMITDVILSSTMIAAKAQNMDLRCLAVGLAALAVGLFLFASAWGPAGAALAVVIGLCARIVARLHWAKREFGLAPVWPLLMRLALACALGLAALRWADLYGAVAAALASLLAFAVTMVLAGTWGRHPLERLRSDFSLLRSRTPPMGSPNAYPSP